MSRCKYCNEEGTNNIKEDGVNLCDYHLRSYQEVKDVDCQYEGCAKKADTFNQESQMHMCFPHKDFGLPVDLPPPPKGGEEGVTPVKLQDPATAERIKKTNQQLENSIQAETDGEEEEEVDEEAEAQEGEGGEESESVPDKDTDGKGKGDGG